MAENANVNNNAATGGEENTGAVEAKTYSQDEVDRLIQSEADRRVTEAVKKKDKEAKEKIKLATMSEQEKYEFELSQREKALQDKENELAIATNKVNGTQVLSDAGLPAQLIDLVVDVDNDIMGMNIKLLNKYFRQAVKDEVKKSLAGGAPKASSDNTIEGGISKERFKKMNIVEQQELYRTNPDLYQSLI